MSTTPPPNPNPSLSYKKFDIRKRNPNPKSVALLVIDMQNYFSTIAKPILPFITTTINLCRKSKIPIIYTRHCHKSVSDHGMLSEWWNEIIVDGTVESQLLNEVGFSENDGDILVEKSTYSGFVGTGLEVKLREMGIEEVIVTGVMTNLCCETTARDAFTRGFRVFFSIDATGTSENEFHEATLLNLAYGFAYLVDCERLSKALG